MEFADVIKDIANQFNNLLSDTAKLKEFLISIVKILGVAATTTSVFVNLIKFLVGTLQLIFTGLKVMFSGMYDLVRVFITQTKVLLSEFWDWIADSAPDILVSEEKKNKWRKETAQLKTEFFAANRAFVGNNKLFDNPLQLISEGWSGKLTDEIRDVVNNIVKSLDKLGEGKEKIETNITKPLTETAKAAAAASEAVKDYSASIAEEMRFNEVMQRREMFGGDVQFGTPKGFELRETKFDEERNRLKALSQSLYDSTRTAQEVYDKKKKDIETATQLYDEEGKAILDVETATRALKQASDELFLATNPWVNDVKNIFANFASGFEEAILQAKSFSDVLKGLAQDILRVMLRQLVLRQLFNIGGALLGQTGFGKSIGIGGNLGDLTFGGGRASGGPVSSNSMYMVGEEGPELFVPRTNGYIVPNGIGNSSGVTINQNNVFQSGVTRAEVFSLIPRIKAETMAAVVDGRARGGSFSRAITA